MVCLKLMNTSRQGVYLVLLAATLWGSSGVSAQYLFRSYALSPGAVTMIRLLFSGLILTALGLLQGSQPGKMFRERSTVIRLIIFSLFGTLMIQLSFLITIEKTNAATATVLHRRYPPEIAWNDDLYCCTGLTGRNIINGNKGPSDILTAFCFRSDLGIDIRLRGGI